MPYAKLGSFCFLAQDQKVACADNVGVTTVDMQKYLWNLWNVEVYLVSAQLRRQDYTG